MGRKRLVNELYLYINGYRVGTLMRLSTGVLKFIYHNDWLELKEARPISLSIPLSEFAYEGILINNFFENLLPDSELIRDRIQARFGTETKNCFDLLTHIGTDCVGAIQFLNKPEPLELHTIQAEPINHKTIAALLKGYKTAPLGMDRNSDFRISIAGAQEKTALLLRHDKWYRPTGATPTTHIIKLPIGYLQHANIDLTESIENEWLCLQILSAFGLPVNEAVISHFEDVKTLVVKRFDRRWSNEGDCIFRLLQEDMCQALGVSPLLKYESDGGPGIQKIMDLLKGSFNAIQDQEQFMRSVFLFWILGAIDGHAKNFSISIEALGRYRLTPLYDVLSAYPITANQQLQWEKLKMAMSLKGKKSHYLWNKIQIRHWYAMAEYCQFHQNRMKHIIEETLDKLENVIKTVENKLPKEFPSHIATSIFTGMREMKKRIIS